MRLVSITVVVLALSSSIIGCGKKDNDSARADGAQARKKAERSDDLPGDTLEALVGDWVSEKTGRSLHAIRALDGKSIEFQVAEEGDFDGEYKENEVRFRVKPAADGGYHVLDRYRPTLKAGQTFTKSGYAACLSEHDADQDGAPLPARLVSADVLDVTFVFVGTRLILGASGEAGPTNVDDCDQTVERVLTVRLLRKK